MQSIQLYIQGERVDMFKDESVTLTESIQNVRDIDKIFTSFTRSFSVPASKINNKIFKHYYNSDIVGGFDARKKVASFIELNDLAYKDGKVKLEGVDLKNNKAHTYRITFFGNIVDLKDKLGEKKLSDLSGLSAYTLNYDASTIETKLTTAQSSSNHIIAPLITHTQRLFFDSGTDVVDTGNLNDGSANKGVKFNELKYAIRVNKIIEAIESEIGRTFTTDFFNNTTVEEFDHLFLWLHRKSGKVEDLSGTTTKVTTQVNWNQTNTTGLFVISNTQLTSGYDPTDPLLTRFQLNIDVATGETDPFDIRIERDGTPVYSKSNHTGDIVINALGGTPDFFYTLGNYNVYIISNSAITFTKIEWELSYDVGGSNEAVRDYTTGGFSTSTTFQFNVQKQMPDITVLGFLTGLFKLFNLTGFVVDDVSSADYGKIKVQKLDDFYANPTIYDITSFVDTNSSQVNVALPYKEVVFKFKDTKTFLANKFGEISNREWGSTTNLQSESDLSGGVYKIEVPFGHMLFERLTNVTGAAQTNIQIGYNVDNNQSAYLGSPLLFYPINLNSGGISFVDVVNSDNVATSHKQLTNINMPFNSVATAASSNSFNFNFNAETSEYTGDSSFTNSLYQKYYSTYIASVFNTKNRITKVKAYLPLRILMNFNLGDRFTIAGNQHKINSVSTNLMTGVSDIELLNDV